MLATVRVIPCFIHALLIVSAAAAQSTQPTTIPSVTAPMPRAELTGLYQKELGARYSPAISDKLFESHLLMEQYFANPSQRKRAIAAIEKIGLDPNILGRIARIRLGWPKLEGGIYYINERYGPHEVLYFLGLPSGYERTRSCPLVIKLPTADAFVTDPRPTADEVTKIYTGWMTEELKRHPDAIVLMPLLNLDELWGPSYAGMNYVFAPMQHAADRVNIDPARVYLIGHSMSAHAAWNLALHYPTYFAAFNALAGAASADWQRVRLMDLRNVLPVVWHDADDKVIKVESSRSLVKILRLKKCEVDYEETRGVGHVPDDSILERAYQKLRARARELYPRHVSQQSVRPDTLFNRNDWLQIWQPIKPGKERRLLFRGGYGFMIVYDNTFMADATLSAGNRIDATTDNVASLRFYLNDQMVDFSKPVTIVVNKKGRFEDKVKSSVEEMLKDQLFMGRGWRYYTGVIDIDFGAAPSTSRSAGGAGGRDQ
ncbi:MAG: alpha/beta hydrolase-fold protein [Tepidisphaeraceae bacterium]